MRHPRNISVSNAWQYVQCFFNIAKNSNVLLIFFDEKTY